MGRIHRESCPFVEIYPPPAPPWEGGVNAYFPEKGTSPVADLKTANTIGLLPIFVPLCL